MKNYIFYCFGYDCFRDKHRKEEDCETRKGKVGEKRKVGKGRGEVKEG